MTTNTSMGCPTCMMKIWADVSDPDTGTRVLSYLCTSEIFIKKDGTMRIIKPCPETTRKTDEQRS